MFTDVNPSQESEEMGQIASRISKLFHIKGTPSTVTADEDEKLETVVAYHVDITLPRVDSGPTYPLATPRSALRRDRPTTPSETTPEKPPFKRLRDDLQYLSYPVLKDNETIKFVLGSKVSTCAT